MQSNPNEDRGRASDGGEKVWSWAFRMAAAAMRALCPAAVMLVGEVAETCHRNVD